MTLGPNAIAVGDMSLRTLGDVAELAGTIKRMLGVISMIPNTTGSFQIGIGVSVITRDAAALGATAVPNPLGVGTSNRQGWYYWMVNTLGIGTSDEGILKEFDIRSARRIRAGFTLALVFESGAYTGGITTVTINWQSRNLWSKE